MMDWKKLDDTSSIPDGLALVFGPAGIELVSWNADYQCWDDSEGDDFYKSARGYFTHWMHLEAPK